jgi:hypothetical protein
MNFYRACPKHRDEIDEDFMCPQGHKVDSWLVVGDDGTVVGKAWEERYKMEVGEEALKLPKRTSSKPPYTPCIHGHMDWSLRSNGRYQCKACQRKAWQKQSLNRSQLRREGWLKRVGTKEKRASSR